MQTSQKILMVAGFAVLAVVAGGVIGWWGGRDWGDNNPSPIAITAPPSSTPPVNPPAAIPQLGSRSQTGWPKSRQHQHPFKFPT